MHNNFMATKTISIELDVYNRLKERRKSPRESFSQILRRAKWDDESLTGQKLLNVLEGRIATNALLSDEDLNTLDNLQEQDSAPEDKWASS